MNNYEYERIWTKEIGWHNVRGKKLCDLPKQKWDIKIPKEIKEMNNKTREKNYRLMKKLMTEKFGAEELELCAGNFQIDLKVKSICTAELCLCIAIAKRTKASIYLKSGTIVLYAAIDKPVSHYIRWADKYIKGIIETE